MFSTSDVSRAVACRCRIRAAENKIPGKLPSAMRRILAFPGCCHHDGQEREPGIHGLVSSAFGVGMGMGVAWGLRGFVGAWLPGAARLVSTDLTRFSLFASTRPETLSKTWQRTGSPSTVDHLQIVMAPGQDDTLSARHPDLCCEQEKKQVQTTVRLWFLSGPIYSSPGISWATSMQH